MAVVVVIVDVFVKKRKEKIRSNKFSIQKNPGPKTLDLKVFNQKKNWVKIKFGQKKLWSKKFLSKTLSFKAEQKCRLKKFWVQKFGVQKF